MAAAPKRVLRLTGTYHKKDEISSEEFHKFMSSEHGVQSAIIHEKYGIIRYQLTFSASGTRDLVNSLRLPYKLDDHDATIEYYFDDVAALIGVSSDETFKKLHMEAVPYLKMDETTVSCSWVETFLDDKHLVNIKDGTSTLASFKESNDIKVSDQAADKYY